MADDADRADERIQNIIDGRIAIASGHARNNTALIPCNQCYWCDSYVADGLVYCDADCIADSAHERQRRKDLGL